jgi:hypothetical protein
VTDRTGYTGNRAKRVFKGLQSFFLQIDVAEIVLHKADQPNTFFDFLDTDSLTSKDRAEVDFLAVETNAPAAGDVDNLVVERVVQFRQAAVGAGGRGWKGYKLPRGTLCRGLGRRLGRIDGWRNDPPKVDSP